MKKLQKAAVILSAMILSVCLFACGDGSKNKGENGEAPMRDEAESSYSLSKTDSGIVEQGAKIIYRSNYVIENDEIGTVIEAVSEKVKEFGGYISSSSEYGDYANILYRVPVSRFEDFISSLDGMDKVTSKDISSEDVTKTFNEYSAKISALEQAKEAYEKLLQTPGISISEITNVLEKIENVNSQLLYYHNQLDSLNNSIDYTYVNVTYRMRGTTENSNEFADFLSEYGNYLLTFVIRLGEIILYIFPFAVLGTGIFFIIYFSVKKKKKNSSPADKE